MCGKSKRQMLPQFFVLSEQPPTDHQGYKSARTGSEAWWGGNDVWSFEASLVVYVIM
jgi:hypothetical protein